MSASDDRWAELRDHLTRRLVPGPGGAIDLIARAWAVRGATL